MRSFQTALLIAAAVGAIAGPAGAADPKPDSGKSQTLQGGIGVQPDLQKKTAPASPTSPADLSPSLSGPSNAQTGKTLGSVIVAVQNKGRGRADSYTVNLFLKKGGKETALRSASGQPLAPNGKKKHVFKGVPVPGNVSAGSYQLCARVKGGGDAKAQTRNNESCNRITVSGAAAKLTTPGISTEKLVTQPVQKGAKGTGSTSGGQASPSRGGTQSGMGVAGSVPLGRSLGASSPAVAGAVRPSLNPDLQRRLSAYQALKRQRTDYERAAREQAAEAERERRRYGAFAGDDCDDSNRRVYAGATEICDGLDNDCNGRVDDGVTIVAYLDRDGDGHGQPESALNVCPSDLSTTDRAGTWLVQLGNDCDDTDPDRWYGCE